MSVCIKSEVKKPPGLFVLLIFEASGSRLSSGN
jgi:hypothetical protein